MRSRSQRRRHLLGGQAAHLAQGERHPVHHGQRRVAAGEEQAQHVVLDRHGIEGIEPERQGLILQGGLLTGVAAGHLVPPDLVDVAPLADADQPGDRVLGHALPGPLLHRSGEGLLHRLLGEVEVTGQPDQGGQHPGRVLPVEPPDLLFHVHGGSLPPEHPFRIVGEGNASCHRPGG